MSQTEGGLGDGRRKKSFLGGMIDVSGRLHSLEISDRGSMSVIEIYRQQSFKAPADLAL